MFFIPAITDNVANVLLDLPQVAYRAVARTLIGGGGFIFIYSGSARLTSFEINFISKETSRARPEYMNIHPPPPINALATALVAYLLYEAKKGTLMKSGSKRLV